jgi:hypothetical protein
MAVYLWGAGSSVSDREIGHSGRRSIGVPSAARRKLSCSRLDKTLVERRIASLYNAVATVHDMIWLNRDAIAPKAWICREAAIICPIGEQWGAPALPNRLGGGLGEIFSDSASLRRSVGWSRSAYPLQWATNSCREMGRCTSRQCATPQYPLASPLSRPTLFYTIPGLTTFRAPTYLFIKEICQNGNIYMDT